MWNGPIILMFMSRCTNVTKFKLKRLKIMGIKNPFVLPHTLKIPMYTVPLYKLHYLISETFFSNWTLQASYNFLLHSQWELNIKWLSRCYAKIGELTFSMWERL
jgi:hypothetical protein